MLTEALRAPIAVGVNVTLIEQLFPAKILLPHLFVWEKSPGFEPERPMLVMLRVAVPLLVSVTLCAALAASKFCEPKVRLEADRLTAGAEVGGGLIPPPPPPPPQAAHIPTTRRAVANKKAAGRRRIADDPRSIASASTPTHNHRYPTGE
jgi:hypothetical protein